MIIFNENDFNISKIKRESKLFNLNTIAKYWIYGLKQTNNPILYIQYDNHNRDTVEIKKKMKLKNFSSLLLYKILNLNIEIGMIMI